MWRKMEQKRVEALDRKRSSRLSFSSDGSSVSSSNPHTPSSNIATPSSAYIVNHAFLLASSHSSASRNPYVGTATKNSYVVPTKNPYSNATKNPYSTATCNPHFNATKDPYSAASNNPYSTTSPNPYGVYHDPPLPVGVWNQSTTNEDYSISRPPFSDRTNIADEMWIEQEVLRQTCMQDEVNRRLQLAHTGSAAPRKFYCTDGINVTTTTSMSDAMPPMKRRVPYDQGKD